MAMRQPGYVESWDKSEFPFHLDRSGLVRYHQRVVIASDDTVLEGHEAVASAIVEAWCADNPTLVGALVDGWIESARAADDTDRKARKHEDARLADHPELARLLAMKHGAGEVFKRAELSPHQVRVLELRFDGRTFVEIGHAFGVSNKTAHEYVEKALAKILDLDHEPEGNASVLSS